MKQMHIMYDSDEDTWTTLTLPTTNALRRNNWGDGGQDDDGGTSGL